MLTWDDILKFASSGNPVPSNRVEKTTGEWKQLLTEEQFYITRKKGTERANSSQMCNLFEPGIYQCVCCKTPLFDSTVKFHSGTGWPSFTQPIDVNNIAYHNDAAFGMVRIEATCNVCDAHLGHVFPDGPAPSGLRYCINAIALQKMEKDNTDTKQNSPEAKVTFGGGCFWCTEAMFQQLKGVIKVQSGYSGGKVINPSYEAVCTGATGHAEVIEVTYYPSQISFDDLVKIHLTTHNPTTPNRQGADKGTQYRSIIFYRNAEEKEKAEAAIEEIQQLIDDPIVTEIKNFEVFYPAEQYHNDYYLSNTDKPYCQAVINPKLKKMKELYKEKLK